MKKFLAVILAVMLCVSLLAACPKKADDNASSEEAAPANVELRTVGMFGGTDPSANAYEKVILDFQRANPNIIVNDESATADDAWKAGVIGDCNAGNEPDVLFFFTDATADDILSKFVSIEEIQEEYPDYASNIKDSVWTYVTKEDGKRYGVPIRGYWEGMFVNEDLFQANSIALPTDWAGLEDAIDKFAATDITPVAVALGEVPHYWIEHVILAYGGTDAIYAAKDIGSDTSKIPQSWIDGFSAFKTLADKKAFPANTSAMKDADAGELFKSKGAAMQVDGSWYSGGITQPETTSVIAFPSAISKTPDSIIAGFSSGFYISRKAWEDEAKQEAAVKFVEAVTSNDAIAAYCQVAGSAAADVEIDGTNISKPVADGNAMAAKAVNAAPATDTWLSLDCCTVMRTGADNIAAGKAEAKAVLEEAIALNK
jgi:raffinose/stachyose/melibiose transport system substrate-binding protein